MIHKFGRIGSIVEPILKSMFEKFPNTYMYVDTLDTFLHESDKKYLAYHGGRNEGVKDVFIISFSSPFKQGYKGEEISYLRSYRDFSGFNTFIETEEDASIGYKALIQNQEDITLGGIYKLDMSEYLEEDDGINYYSLDVRIIPSETIGDSICNILNTDIVDRLLHKLFDKTFRTSLRKNWRATLDKGVSSLIAGLEASYRKDMTNLSQKISQAKENLQIAANQMIAPRIFLDNTELMVQKIHHELESAKGIKGVADALISNDGSFYLYTDKILISQGTQTDSEGRRYFWDIGKLFITVQKNGYRVILKNLNKVRAGYSNILVGHPHVVDRDGGVCLGDIESVIPELLEKFEYSSLASILINFAKCANLDDVAGKTVRRWPTILK